MKRFAFVLDKSGQQRNTKAGSWTLLLVPMWKHIKKWGLTWQAVVSSLNCVRVWRLTFLTGVLNLSYGYHCWIMSVNTSFFIKKPFFILLWFIDAIKFYNSFGILVLSLSSILPISSAHIHKLWLLCDNIWLTNCWLIAFVK